MQADPNAGMPLEQLEHWQIAVLIGLLNDIVEVADRLVVVDDKDKADRSSHQRHSWKVGWEGLDFQAPGGLRQTIGRCFPKGNDASGRQP